MTLHFSSVQTALKWFTKLAAIVSGSKDPLTLVGAPIFFSNFAFQHFQNFVPSLANSKSCSSFEYLSFVLVSARRMASLCARLSLLRLEYIAPDLGRPAAFHTLLLESMACDFRQSSSCDHQNLKKLFFYFGTQ